MTMTRKKCWICGRPVYSKISDICRPCERAWRVLVLKERGEENIDECYGCTWKGAPRDLFPCSECRGSGKEGPDWYSPAGEPLIYRNDDIPADEDAKDSSDLISRQAAIETIARIDKTNGDTVCFTGKAIISYLNDLPSVQPKTGWIPIKWHEITDEEREREGYPKDWVVHIDCEMPCDEQEILVQTKKGYIRWDVCYEDGEFSLDSGWDWIEDIVAWIPLPEPYREGGE